MLEIFIVVILSAVFGMVGAFIAVSLGLISIWVLINTAIFILHHWIIISCGVGCVFIYIICLANGIPYEIEKRWHAFKLSAG